MTVLFWVSYAAQWAITGVLAFAVVLLLREQGWTMLRGSGHRATQGPAVDAPLPSFTLEAVGGGAIDLGRRKARPSLVFVAGASCAVCVSAMKAFGDLATPSTEFVLVCVGSRQQCASVGSSLPPYVARLIDSTLLSATKWEVGSTPFLVAVDKEGVVRGKASSGSKEAMEALLQRLLESEEVGVASQHRTLNGAGQLSGPQPVGDA